MDLLLSVFQVSVGVVVGFLAKSLLASSSVQMGQEVAVLRALLEQEKEKNAELSLQHRVEIEEAKKQFALEFECLSQRIFKESSKEFSSHSQEKLSSLLSPLAEKMELFQRNLHEMCKTAAAERLTLKCKMDSVAEQSKILASEAHHLARSLKGDVKRQGAWGELVLQKVLEASGLRQNEEYTLQGVGLSLSDAEGRRMQPDVVVHLPDAKKVIIDAKMSYRHYDDYINAVSEGQKEESLRKFLLSLKEHVRGLSEKNYAFAIQQQSPDFVLLFVPIEAMFSLALEADPSLFEEAWKRSVILVSPANLLAILRTIEVLWKGERQNRNTQRIAEEAGALYDKFVDFLKDLESMGKSLKQTHEHFDKALSKLSEGRGNLIRKTEELKRLGLKTKKQIPDTYLEEEITSLN